MKIVFASLAVVGALAFVGCDEKPPMVDFPEEKPPVAEATDRSLDKREVVITNVVTVVTTNVVVEKRVVCEQRCVEEVVLSPRKTAPYLVSASSLRASELQQLLREGGARIIECDPGAVAIVEAPAKVVENLKVGGVLHVRDLSGEEKRVGDVGENVKITPLSSIDAKGVADAVRTLGGELKQVVAVGQPAIRAKLSREAVEKVSKLGSVLKIERDEQ